MNYLFLKLFLTEMKLGKKDFLNYLIQELKLPPDLPEWSYELEKYSFLFPPTNSQIDEIRNILGFSFFKIVEINTTSPNLLIPIVNPNCLRNKNKALGINALFKNDNATLFFHTQINALKFAYNRIINWCQEDIFEIKGKLEHLTSTPILFKKYIKSTPNVIYDYTKSELLIKKIKLDDFLKIHSFLHEKPLVIEKISLFEAKEMYATRLVDEKDYSHLKIPMEKEIEKLRDKWEKKYNSPYY